MACGRGREGRPDGKSPDGKSLGEWTRAVRSNEKSLDGKGARQGRREARTATHHSSMVRPSLRDAIRYHGAMNDARELSDYLAALENEGSYLVDCVLGNSDAEITEKVYRFDADADADADGNRQGPYIRKRFARDSGMGEAYERIHKATRAGVSFRHIPRVFAFYRDESEAVAIIEYVEGDTLRARVDKAGAGLEAARLLFPALCDAVRELQELFTPPLIHRDLKPDNIIVRDGSVVIIDFGIARAYRYGAQADTTHLGTRAYAPPEQYGYAQTSQRSDVYALGCLLFFLLSGRDPSPEDLCADFEGLSLPWELRTVIQKACAFDPAARFANARELQDAFAQAIGQGARTSAVPLSWQDGDAGGWAGDAGTQAAGASWNNVGGRVNNGGAQVTGGWVNNAGAQVAGGSWSNGGGRVDGGQPRVIVNPPMRQRRRGFARNIVIAVVFVFLLFECLCFLVDPSLGQYQDDLIENAFIYGAWDPLIIGAICFALLDRKHLRERRAWAARIDKRYDKWIVIGLVLLAFVSAFVAALVGYLI